MKNEAKSSVGALVKYLEDKKTHDRVADVKIYNCVSEDAESAALEIQCTQNINQRAKSDKTYHMVLSCAAGDNVSNETLQEMARKMVDALGYSKHQHMAIIHDDTDNKHIHIVINKIDPKTYRIVNPGFPYKIMSDVCSRLENEYGLQKVNHKARLTKGENLAHDFENQTGIKSLLNWAKENVLDGLKQANNWEEFNKVLNDNGLKINAKNKGFAIETLDGKNGMKASTLAREFSQKNLEKKFGQYVPGKVTITPKKTYTEKPLYNRFDTNALYKQYQDSQTQVSEVRQKYSTAIRSQKAKEIQSAKDNAKLKRNAVKLMGISPAAKKVMYQLISKSLLNRIKGIHTEAKQTRPTIKRESWADWLRTQAMAGNLEAIKALRGRSDKDNLVFNTIQGRDESPEVSSKRDNITKAGTVIYANEKFTLRDDGKSIKVSRGATHEGMIAALKVAQIKYGNTLKVDGNDDFKKKAIIAVVAANLNIRFQDVEMDKKLTLLQDKFNENDSARTRGSVGNDRYGPTDFRTFGIAKKAAQVNDIRANAKRQATETKNNMRDVQVRDVAPGSNRTSMLLHGDAQNNLVNEQPNSAFELRRDSSQVKPKGRGR